MILDQLTEILLLRTSAPPPSNKNNPPRLPTSKMADLCKMQDPIKMPERKAIEAEKEAIKAENEPIEAMRKAFETKEKASKANKEAVEAPNQFSVIVRRSKREQNVENVADEEKGVEAGKTGQAMIREYETQS